MRGDIELMGVPPLRKTLKCQSTMEKDFTCLHCKVSATLKCYGQEARAKVDFSVGK